MGQKLKRLFIIKTRFEAYLIIFALATGAMQRGKAYLAEFPGLGGHLLFWACSGSVLLAGAKILDALRYEREAGQGHESGQYRESGQVRESGTPTA